jgi:thiol-disulfide isomerase/thioredoxin
MRAPIAAGFLAGLLVSIVLVGAAGLLLVSRPAPGRPTPSGTGVALASPTPPPGAPATIAPSAPSTSEPASAAPTGPPAPAATGPAPTGSTPTASVAPPGSPAASEPAVGLRVGDRAPPLRVAQLGGGEIDTGRLSGQPLWVNFMATYCPSCRDELPLMERMQGELGEAMTILVVDAGEDVDTVASYMTSLGVELPVGVDPANAARDAWGAFVLPVHYWVDGQGIVRGFLYGPADPAGFVEGVRTVLPDAELGS